MARHWGGVLASCCLAIAMAAWGKAGYAEPRPQQAVQAASAADQSGKKSLREKPKTGAPRGADAQDPQQNAVNNGNKLGISFVKNVVSDQKAIWTSPARLRWADGNWLFPSLSVTAGFFLTDRSAAFSLSNDPLKLTRYRSFSNYGVGSLIAAGGGMYVWGRISHNDHQRETGVLAGEAAIDSLIVNTPLQFAFGRERPYQDGGRGNLFSGGTSFPSDHAIVAWSIASVVAHEYPGWLAQLSAYGMATAVSASRVFGKEHFPSDVVVGSMFGWLIGREVYKLHHDTELGGSGWSRLAGNEEGEDHRPRNKMGSPFVPLDSWVYGAFERLAGLGYANSAILGLKPWTRIECARLTSEAGDALQLHQTAHDDAAALQARLQKEFAYEINLLSGGRNLTANVESLYTRVVSISGPPLTDGYHFGQTIAYDFGRPFERGTNAQVGGSFSAAAGPVAIYVRAEYQHAPSAPAPSDALRNVVASADNVPVSVVPAGSINTINRPRLLDAYATVNLSNWQLVIGKQSLDWGPGVSGSMIWSDNIEPVDMVRLVSAEPFEMPGFLRHLGPVRVDQFFGRLAGHPYVQRPFEYGQKINLKPFAFLELGFGRTVTIGGTHSGQALTANNLWRSFLGVYDPTLRSVPGDNHSEMDWVFHVPKVRNYIVLYGDAYADDDILPIENLARNPWHPGIYITRIPGILKLDFHMEGVSTESPTAIIGGGNRGLVNYFNSSYPDGYTNNRNLIGNTVGREGRTIQCWFTYWVSADQKLQLTYKHNSVNSDFIPGGGAWQDYSVSHEIYLKSGFYAKSMIQLEHIQRYPSLFTGTVNNVTASVELGFSPVRPKQ